MKMKNEVRLYKTDRLYASLYGREAYEVWKARESEIDALRMGGTCSKASIVKMYEENLRKLKAAGGKVGSEHALRKRSGKILAAA